ncbi:hypothetical protein RR48_12636 [Papilio machaon]|uniref:Uncharacterized protein n=1 Tax=Papilio machaon TaxID=76193 RepID=A0A194QR21_PAPMA|nr:hypothetical protein RR48_12636 [Papilio machaon]
MAHATVPKYRKLKQPNRGHPVKYCRSSSTCRICHKRHHTLLHHSPTASTQETPIQINTVATSQSNTTYNKTVLLGTAIVAVQSEDGYTTVLRALIDPGSQGCLISERAAQLLKAKRYSTKGNIIGVGSVKSRINESIQIEVSSRFMKDFSIKIKAFVISRQLTSRIPNTTLQYSDWPHIQGLELADPSFNISRSVDLLLGVDVYSQIILSEVIRGPPGTPCAQNTTLGYIIFGTIDDSLQSTQENIIVMHQITNLDDMLKSLWEIDTTSKRKLTQDEQICEELFQNTTSRSSNGRYIVQLPFKTDNPKSMEGNSREIALRRFKQLESKLERSPGLKQKYNEVLEEYLTMGHMEKIPQQDIVKKGVYLPHHAVVRDDKESTKVRIVFDASCKNSDGVSLNDELLVGPVLQEDLRSIILRWRTHKICFASDIEKMYRMILLKKEHTDFQRILWRQGSSEDNEVEDFRLLTVTFGTAAAPYLAVRTLMQIANDECENFPKAAKVIREDFYVDDLMSGCDTIQEAIDISKQLIEILKRCGFKLKKWTSNSAEFLETIEPQDRSTHACLNLRIDGTVKALGLTWNLGEDNFQYSLNLPTISTKITKRTILADIQRMFDPLGWLAPVIVRAKILVQKLWLEGLNWDDEISESLRKEWLKIRNDLGNIKEIKIKRWTNTTTSNKNNTFIHGFSDASNKAISAVVYCRTIDQDGNIQTSIVAARTKVAP